MHSTYLHTLNYQFTFRDTEVNESQVLDRALRFGIAGQRFVNNIAGATGGSAKRLVDKLHHIANKTVIKSAPFIDHISRNIGTLPVNINNMHVLAHHILSFFT